MLPGCKIGRLELVTFQVEELQRGEGVVMEKLHVALANGMVVIPDIAALAGAPLAPDPVVDPAREVGIFSMQ
jgi:hypothetical protein